MVHKRPSGYHADTVNNQLPSSHREKSSCYTHTQASLKSKQLPVTLRKTNTYQADTDEPAVSIHVQRHKQLQCIQIRGPGSDLIHLLENKRLPFTPQPPKIPTHTQKSICHAHREEQAKVLYPHPPKNQSPCTHTRTSS